MDPRVQTGFLGTGGSLMSDITLLAYILLIVPAMIMGFIFARRKMYKPHHKMTMTAITLINWVLILFLMIVSYGRNAAPGVPERLGQPYFLSPSVHLLFGLTAQLIATYLVIRMWFEKRLPQWFMVKNFKRFMRLTLGLWLITATLGVVTYLTWYVFNDTGGAVTDEGGEAAVAAADQSAADTTVLLRDFRFQPAEIAVPAGTTIRFLNQDTAPHTVTFDDGSFDSGNFFTAESTEVTFDTLGTYPLYCALHGAPGGVGMAMVVSVGGADETAALPTVDPALLEMPQPTPAPTVDPPSLELIQQDAPPETLAGMLYFVDVLGPGDTVVLDLQTSIPAPPQGTQYILWLIGPNVDPLRLGLVQPDASGQTRLQFAGPGSENLVANYTEGLVSAETIGVTVSAPTGEMFLETAASPVASVLIRQIVGRADATPGNVGYATGGRRQAEEVIRQVDAARAALDAGNLEAVHSHAESIVNVIEGTNGPNFGDLDQDGTVRNPGDGFGLLPGGNSTGYIRGASSFAQQARDAADATEAIRVHSEHVVISGDNAMQAATQVRDDALALADATDAAQAGEIIARLESGADLLLNGTDLNGDGIVDALPGEGTIFSQYLHAQYTAAMPVAATGGLEITPVAPEQVVPAPVATEEVMPMGTGEAQPVATEEATAGS